MDERTATVPQPIRPSAGTPRPPGRVPLAHPALDAAGRATDHPWIHPVPAFDDNYIWVIAPKDPGGGGSRDAVVVDPGDAAPVIAWLEAHGRDLATILITHHHRDHVGGVAGLRRRYPGVVVHGPVAGPFDDLDERHGDGANVTLDALGCTARVMAVPGHTLDHIAYVFDELGPVPGEPVLFCGDTLFAAGCGRLFEGTPEQMHRSLATLAALPAATRVHCAHEYTLANLAFARAAAPADDAVAGRERAARVLREHGEPTVPSTLGAELATNPFVRATTAAELARLRAWKDGFRG